MDPAQPTALDPDASSLRALIEACPDGMLVHRGGLVVFCNQRGAAMLGFERAGDVVGKPVVDFVHPDDRASVRTRIAALDTTSTVPFAEERLIRTDGSLVTASVGAVSLLFEGERCVVAIARDVTDQRRVQAQLVQAERLASLGALAASVAHEINNPLTYVLLRLDVLADLCTRLRQGMTSLEEALTESHGHGGASALVRRHLDPELVEQIADHAATASEGAQRVRRIVGDLRVFSSGQDDAQQVLDVHEPLDLAASMASFELKHRATLVKRYAAENHVSASVNRLAQIFLNLIMNAIQALPHDTMTNEVRLVTRDEGDRVVVEVSDTGVGIPKEHLPRLFEPFFTTKPVGVGSGLGLAICHGIVSSLGGTIRVESQAGARGASGTTFSVVLPGTRIPIASLPPPASAQRSWRSGRILVVDDEPHIAESLAIVLGRFGQVVTVASGAAARNLLVLDAAFDVIVCDVVMPGLTGIDLHEHLLDTSPRLAARMLFTSGGRADDTTRAFAESMGHRWLDKPIDVRALEERVIDLLKLSQARDGRGG